MKALVVVAHPDDETLFLGGYMLKNSEWDWTVVSVTHSLESPRGQEFQQACRLLGATPLMLGQEDIFEKNLNQDLIVSRLKELSRQSFDIVFTHNQNGEYGHPHHICVHQAVKRVFPKPYFFGYNSFSDVDIKLNGWELEKKKRILKECYVSQSSKFFMSLFEIAVERIISPSYVEASIDAAFFGKNDLWSYESSSYELARIERIVRDVQALNVNSIAEVGAHEGIMTKKLSAFTHVFAFERSEVAFAKGKERCPAATWVLGDFETEVHGPTKYEAEAVLFSEVIYYFNDYKELLKSLGAGPRFVVVQNVSKIHKQIEVFMIEQGWSVRQSALSNPFGLGIYERGDSLSGRNLNVLTKV